MRRVAFATYEGLPNLSSDDQSLREILLEDFKIETPMWSDPSVEWDSFDAVVLRSVWDYHKRINEFENWLDDLEVEQPNVFNPIEVVRWNLNKKYLLELETTGCPIVPSILLKKGDAVSLEQILKQNNWADAVVKPVISASALRTVRVSLKNLKSFESDFLSWIAEQDLIVQPFVSDIQSHGEYSVLYFDSSFSHAVLKTPKAGDFRVQEEFGGVTKRVDAPKAVQHLADDLNQWLFEKFRTPLLFARIDIVVIEGKPAVGEIELIEPYLFFSHHGPSRGLFKSALEKALKG